MNFSVYLQQIAQQLTTAGIEHADCEAEVMVADTLQINRTTLTLRRREPVPADFLEKFSPLLERRLKREPWQHITGIGYFRNLELRVNAHVLIPRPETELLVDLALQDLAVNAFVADIGTGSGAIALALAQERPDLHVHAVDLSEEALAVAQENARRHPECAVTFHCGDLTAPLPDHPWEAFVANLPYISDEEYRTLPDEVRRFDPRMALTAPENGLALIRRLSLEARAKLRPEGVLALEIGETQGDAVVAALNHAGFREVRTHRDYTDRIRFATGKK